MNMLKTPGKGLVSLSYVQRERVWVRESVDVSERVHCTLYTAQHNSVCTYYKPSAPEMRSKIRRYLYFSQSNSPLALTIVMYSRV